jgi:AsmA protein
MSRRSLALLFGLAALLALAIAPWTMSSARLNTQVKQQLRDGYGLDLIASGRITLALLPVPRLKFTDTTLAAPDGTPLVRGAQLRGELRLLPLLAARLEIADLSLADARIAVALHQDGTTSWDEPVAKLKARAAASEPRRPHIPRLLIARSDLDIDDQRSGSRIHIGSVNAVLRWPDPDRGLDLSASGRWGGETIHVSLSGMQPAGLAAGRTSPVVLRAVSRLAELTLSGTVNLASGLSLNGQVAATIPALDSFCRWTGLARPRPETGRPLIVAGEVAIGAGEIGFPQLRLTFNGAPLDGAVMFRRDGARPSLRATLAGDTLDLSPFLPPPGAPRGRWPLDSADLDALKSADIDLRLSASAVQLDTIRLGDVAVSLLTSPEKIELALSRATLNGGVVKGRAALASTLAGSDLKLQASMAQLDLGNLLASLGQPRSVTGVAQGQAALEASGAEPEDWLRSLSGRAAILVRTGEVSGLSLAEGLRQSDERPGGLTAWRGGRTAFQQAQLSLSLSGGVAEVQDGTLDGTSLHTSLHGQVSLPEGKVALRARTVPPLDSARESPGFVLDVDGRWDSPRIVPSVAAFIQSAAPMLSPESR